MQKSYCQTTSRCEQLSLALVCTVLLEHAARRTIIKSLVPDKGIWSFIAVLPQRALGCWHINVQSQRINCTIARHGQQSSRSCMCDAQRVL